MDDDYRKLEMEGKDGTWIATDCDHKLLTWLCLHQDTSSKPPALLIHSISSIISGPLSSYSSPSFYQLRYFLSKLAMSQ